MKYGFVLFLAFLLLPLSSKATLTGGNFEIYADSFSVVQDQLTTGGGTFTLYNTSGEAAGVLGQAPTGTLSVDLEGFNFSFGETFTLGDGVLTREFVFKNLAGWGNATLSGNQVVVDTGGMGGLDKNVMRNRIAEAINSTNANIGIHGTNNGVDAVNLVNTRTAGVDGNVPIVETVDNAGFVVTGMSGGGASTGLVLKGGFQAMERSSLSMNINSNTVALGTLSLGEVKSGIVSMSVTTDSFSGYSVSVTEDGNLRKGEGGAIDDIDDVSDGSVSAGSEEYGISTAGVAGLLFTDTAIAGVLPIAETATSVENQITTVSFRAAIGNMSRAGAYSHVVTFSATANP